MLCRGIMKHRSTDVLLHDFAASGIARGTATRWATPTLQISTIKTWTRCMARIRSSGHEVQQSFLVYFTTLIHIFASPPPRAL